MSITRIVASRCHFCGKPIEDTVTEALWYTGQRSEYTREGWTLLLNGKAAHTNCANEATKDRLFREEEPPV